MKRIIAFDVMGNDNGVKPAVMAAFDFIKTNKDYKIILVGDADQIAAVAGDMHHEDIEVVDIKEEVKGELKARSARDNQNSMSVAINLVKDKKADAVLSSGNSAAYLAMSTLILKRLEGVKRPAFMPIFPTIVENKKFLLLDAGANLEVTSDMLVQWAKIASIFSNKILGVNQPKVGIINIGTEDEKGFPWAREAHQELKKTPNINYVGFIETRDLLKAEVDVAVVDGYAGNIVLKTMEGTAMALMKMIRASLTSKLKYKIGALISKGAFRKVRDQLDYRNIGAAWIIGVNGLVLKSHGSSDAKAFGGALNQVKQALDSNALNVLIDATNSEAK